MSEHHAAANVPPADRDPIAIVGIGCRLPGASGVAELWDLLTSGRNTVGEIPPDRFDIARWFDPVRGRPGRITTRWGGFLDQIDRFDAAFFGISAHEAIRLDPQHRLMLETVWEAIEDAGAPAAALAGSRTGVYTACLAAEYWDTVRRAGLHDMHAATGSGAWGMPAGRISHLLDLRGPSLGVEATCATSLLAVHLACRDLWSGQTTSAIVAGVNLLLSPDLYLGLSEAQLLSSAGRCRFGESDVDGYVRSEGAAAILLKPLADAVRDGDRVYATIRGTAANNNGRSSQTIFAPAPDGQEEMLRMAYRDAGVPPADVDYVEAHGAGTPMGDTVELSALATVLGEGRPDERPCLVGSVKSNLGHTEVAAGLVGLIKATLAVHHRTIPATLDVERPHRLLEPPGTPVALASRRQPWPETGRPAVAGVSAFGLSATNVHVVLAEAPPVERPPTGTDGDADVLLPLSARHPGALAALARAHADRLDRASGPRPCDVAFSAGTRRDHHDLRLAVVGRGREELAGRLRELAAGSAPSPVTGRPRVVFVFSGKGAQWAGMGRELLTTEPAFRDRLAACDAAIRAEAGWSVLDVLHGAFPEQGEAVIQPTLWAVQVGLAAVWRQWGVEPDLVIGHSMGEIAAACDAGSLSIADGAAVVCRRSALIDKWCRPGAMVSVPVGADEAERAIGDLADRVSVGVINSSHSTVLSGDPEAVDQVVARLGEPGTRGRRVPVRYASHSAHVEPLREPMLVALADLRPRPGATPMHSTALDRPVEGTELDAAYWMANLRRPVGFAAAVGAALSGGERTVFIEVSPHPLLLGAIEDTAAGLDPRTRTVGSLVRGEPQRRSMLTGLATAYRAGCELRWSAVNRGGHRVDLPTYPWQRRRYWADPPLSVPPVIEPDAVAAPSSSPAAGAGATPAGPYVVNLLAEILGMPLDEVDRDATLSRLGVDSVMATRLRVRVAHERGVHLPMRHLLDGRTIAELVEEVAGSRA